MLVFKLYQEASRLYLSESAGDNHGFLSFFIPDGGANIPSGCLPIFGKTKEQKTKDLSLEDIWESERGYLVFMTQIPNDLKFLEEKLQLILSETPDHTSLAWVDYAEVNDEIKLSKLLLINGDSKLEEDYFFDHGGLGVYLKNGSVSRCSDVKLVSAAMVEKNFDHAIHIRSNSTGISNLPHIQPIEGTHIPLSGLHRGSLISKAVIIGGLANSSEIPPKLTYYFNDDNEQVISQEYFVLQNQLSGHSPVFHLAWDPLFAQHEHRTFLAFTGENVKLDKLDHVDQFQAIRLDDGGIIETHFKTIYGETVGLYPIMDTDQGAKLLLHAKPSENGNAQVYQLALSGQFEMTVISSSSKTKNDLSGPTGLGKPAGLIAGNAPSDLPKNPQYLLCGLSGTEYIQFQSKNKDIRGSAMEFIAGKPAFSESFPLLDSSGPKGTTLLSSKGGKYTTSWMKLTAPVYTGGPNGGTVSPPPATYFSMPSENALFTVNSLAEKQEILEYFPSAYGSLLGTTGFFPMVPYAGVTAGAINPYLSATGHRLNDFENQILGPIRKEQISSYIGSYDPSSDYRPATSPKGLFVDINDTGQWGSMLMAQNYDIDPALGATTYNLAFYNLQAELRKAFQSDQQFLVISKNDQLGHPTFKPEKYGSGAFFQNQMRIEGWLFEINVPGPTASPQSDFILFKYCDGTLQDRIKNPLSWTNAKDFNENIDNVKNYLDDYISHGIKQADTDSDFVKFKEVVTDPNWRGILALNVDINIKGFPSEIQGLAAGIDKSAFSAHHLGVNLNQPSLVNFTGATALGFSPEYSSSMFALIDYQDPRYDPDKGAVDLKVSDENPYSFAVLLLKVLFENSAVQNFTSSLQLSIDKLFSNTITKTTVDGTTPTNDYKAILFDGHLVNQGGQPVYTFYEQANQDGEIKSTKFFTGEDNILRYMEVSNGNFVTLKGATGIGATAGFVQSRFSLFGKLAFNAINDSDPNLWDLYSFGGEQATIDDAKNEGLNMANLAIDMSFVISPTGPSKPTFAFNTDYLSLDASLSTARPNSLYNTFPLQITGFLSGDANKLPSSLGFKPMNVSAVVPSLKKIDGAWYGILYDLNLGTPGSLASGTGLIGKLLVSWGVDSKGDDYYGEVGLSLPGASIDSDYFRIENILQLASDSQTLQLTAGKDSYMFTLDKPMIKFLGLGFPDYDHMKTDFFISIFGDPSKASKSLGWYGAIVADDRPIGTSKFSISFMGIGQRVSYDTSSIENVEDAIEALKNNFSGKDFDESKLTFDESSHWLIGTVFKIIDTVEISAVFNDPNVYGVLVELSGEKAKIFDGLKFEVLYKKVSNTVGVYHIELRLPDKFRKFDMGELSFTLPVVAVDIFTDGSFKINLGFPKNLTDFTDSFTVEWLPFKGSGGLYFAYLHPGASTTVPRTTLGKFDPILELGLGLQVGVGKDIDKGALKAGASLTVIGILQGVLAFYEPNDGKTGAGEMYYRVQGTVGVVGKIYGKVDFKIIKASVKAEVSAMASFTLEPYKATPVSLDLKVSLDLNVTVDLLVVTINVHLTFKTKLHLEFTLGHDHLQDAPWGNNAVVALNHSAHVAHLPYMPVFRLVAPKEVALDWQPLVLDKKLPIQLYFTPHLTVSEEFNRRKTSQYVAMLYMDAPVPGITASAGTTTRTSFDNLAEITLAWVLNAYLNAGKTGVKLSDLQKQSISVQELKNIYHTLETAKEPPIQYPDIKAMFNDAFDVLIGLPDSVGATQLNVTVFPMIPELMLTGGPVGSTAASTSFENNYSSFSQANETFIEDATEYFEKLYVDYKTELEKQNDNDGQGPSLTQSLLPDDPSNLYPVTEFAFQDYFQMLVLSELDRSMDYIKDFPYPITSYRSIGSIIDELNNITTQPVSAPSPLGATYNNISAGMIALANQSVPLTSTSSLLIGGYQIPQPGQESLRTIADKFGLNAHSVGYANSAIPGLIITGAKIKVGSSPDYTVTATDTLVTIAKNINPSGAVSVEEVIAAAADQKILNQVLLNIPNINYAPSSTDTFQTVANRYVSSGIGSAMGPTGQSTSSTTAPTADVLRLLEANQLTPGVFQSGVFLNGPTASTSPPGVTFGSTFSLLYVAEKLKTDLSTLLPNIKDFPFLNSQVPLAIPHVLDNASAHGELYTFQRLSEAYSIPVPYLGESNQGITGIFETGETLVIPNMTALEVGNILDGLFGNDKAADTAGMAGRFFLHGLRLPITTGITFTPSPLPSSLPPFIHDPVASFYNITGQQVDAKVIDVNDRSNAFDLGWLYLGKPDASEDYWLQFGLQGQGQTMLSPTGLNYVIPPTEVTKATQVLGTTFSPGATYERMPLAQNVAKHFALKSHIAWSYPGQFEFQGATSVGGSTFPANQKNSQPSIWLLPESLLEVIIQANGQTLLPKLATRSYPSGQTTTSSVKYYNWATFLSVKLKKVAEVDSSSVTLGQTYEIIGADQTSIVYLERLLKYLKQTPSSQFLSNSNVHLLYKREGGAGNGLTSEVLGGIEALLVQSNLSTYTKPPAGAVVAMTELFSQDTGQSNIINSFEKFVELLWSCSIVRSGGFYLYYNDKESNSGLPDDLFTKNPIGEISIVFTYPLVDNEVESFVNSLITGDNIDPTSSSIFIEDESLIVPVATVPPGNIGFEVTRNTPVAGTTFDSSIYLNQTFSLLGYQLAGNTGFTGSVEGLPAGPESPNGNTFIQQFNNVVPVYKYYRATADQLNPLYNSLGKAAATGPNGLNNPYLGVGATAEIHLEWVDLFGNKAKFVGASDGNPGSYYALGQKVGYTDQLLTISKLPNLSLGYHLSTGPILNLEFSFNAAYYQEQAAPAGSTGPAAQKRAKVAIQTYQQACYQLSDIFYHSQIDSGASGISVRTSLDPEKVIQLSKDQYLELLNFITQIYGYLLQISEGNFSAPKPGPNSDGNYILALPTTLANPNTIFGLETEFIIQRNPALVNPDFGAGSGATGIFHVVSEIGPITSNTGSSGGYYGIGSFARSFEDTFKETNMLLKVAQGMDRFEAEGVQQNNNRIWAVRFGSSGINYSVDGAKPEFYAPSPMANYPVSLSNVPIYQYDPESDSGTGFDLDKFQSKYYSGVNLDEWAKSFLVAMDEFLSPKFGVPASIISHRNAGEEYRPVPCGMTMATKVALENPYGLILNAKNCIADKISRNITTIVGPPGPTFNEAQDRFKQSLLEKVSNAYNVDTIIEHPVTVSYGPTGIAGLFGQTKGKPNTASGSIRDEIIPLRDNVEPVAGPTAIPSYSFSTSKILIGTGMTASHLTYLFDTQDAVKNKHMKFNLDFELTHIEHQLGAPISGITGYRPSSWLSFVIPIKEVPPGSNGTIGEIDIPIPLREYPPTPSIRKQFYWKGITGPTNSLPTGTAITGDGVKVENAKYWSYNFEYAEVQAAQDSIQAYVRYGATGATLPHIPKSGSADFPLSMALAQFVESYPAIREDMQNALPKVGVTTSSTDENYIKGLGAITAFAWMATQIAGTWQNWAELTQNQSLKPVLPNSNVYNISESALSESDPSLRLEVRGVTDNKNPDHRIFVSIPDDGGFKPEPQSDTDPASQYYDYLYSKNGDHLPYNDRAKYPFRIFRIEDLNILSRQDAWGGISVVRNEYLLNSPGTTGPKTNFPFIYQTPLTRLKNPLAPVMVYKEVINVAMIASKQPVTATLLDHLTNMFYVVLYGLTTDEQPIQVECNYSYTLNEGVVMETVPLPLFLTVKFSIKTFKDNDKTKRDPIITEMASTISNWMDERGLDKNTSESQAGLQHFDGKLSFKVIAFSDKKSGLPLFELDKMVLDIKYINGTAQK